MQESKETQSAEKAIFQILEYARNSMHKNTTGKKYLLTAAVFPNPSMARYRFSQNWMNWGKILDYPVVMSYTQDIGFFSELLNFTLKHEPDAVFGIGFLWPDMEVEAYWEVKTVKQNKGAGICFFDFTSIDTLVDFEKLRGKVITISDSIMSDTTKFTKVNSVFIDLPDPNFVEKNKHFLTPGEYLEFVEFLLSLSLNSDQDLGRLSLNQSPARY